MSFLCKPLKMSFSSPAAGKKVEHFQRKTFHLLVIAGHLHAVLSSEADGGSSSGDGIVMLERGEKHRVYPLCLEGINQESWNLSI